MNSTRRAPFTTRDLLACVLPPLTLKNWSGLGREDVCTQASDLQTELQNQITEKGLETSG